MNLSTVITLINTNEGEGAFKRVRLHLLYLRTQCRSEQELKLYNLLEFG